MALRRARILPVVLVGGITLATALSLTQPTQVAAQATYEIEPREPAYLYARTCGYCHGHNVAPIIRGRNLPPELIKLFVRNGQGAMPALKPTEITNEELDALALWISQSEADPQEHGK